MVAWPVRRVVNRDRRAVLEANGTYDGFPLDRVEISTSVICVGKQDVAYQET